MKDKNNKVIISCEMNIELKNKLSEIANERECSVSSLIRFILNKYIKDGQKQSQ